MTDFVILLVDLIVTVVEIAIKGVSLIFWALHSTSEWSWPVCIAITTLPSYVAYKLWATHNDAAVFLAFVAATVMTAKLILFVWLRQRDTKRGRNAEDAHRT